MLALGAFAIDTFTNKAHNNAVSSNFLINRRTCLKAIGASLALPLFETMGWAEPEKGKPYKPPVRLGFMYMPHGVIMDQFWPASAESFLDTPPPALESLRPELIHDHPVRQIGRAHV